MARQPFDFYETPPHYIRALKDVIGAPTGILYEPCVGRGQIARRFPSFDRVVTNDLDRRREADTHYNAALGARAWGTLGYSWVITNPPFSQELQILKLALMFTPNVAMLARLSFLEPTKDRTPFWDRYGADCTVIVLPRYSFRNNDEGKRATDNMTCCWLVWWRAQRKGGHLHWTHRRLVR